MADIAQRAGVSKTTVSFVLNNRVRPSSSISPATRERVLEVAETMGYRRNELARAAITGKSRTIGVLMRSLTNEATALIVEGALHGAAQNNFFLKLVALPAFEADDASRQAIRQCVELRLAGVIAIYLSEGATAQLHRETTDYAMPAIVVDRELALPQAHFVANNDDHGMALAVRHLVELDHRRIALVTGKAGGTLSTPREAGFRAATRAAGLSEAETPIVHVDLNDEKQETVVVTALLQSRPRPSAVIAITDASALRVMRTARRLGLAVPDQLSVMGYADLSLALTSDPALTTIHLPFFEMGERALQLLLAPPQARARELLQPHLVARDSTAPCQD